MDTADPAAPASSTTPDDVIAKAPVILKVNMMDMIDALIEKLLEAHLGTSPRKGNVLILTRPGEFLDGQMIWYAIRQRIFNVGWFTVKLHGDPWTVSPETTDGEVKFTLDRHGLPQRFF